METNITCQVAALLSSSQQQASGQSIFWALAAIVLNAMLQPSFSGYIWSGDSFEGYFWPHRSSPFICLIDSAADIWIGAQSFRNSDQRHDDEELANPTAVSARLAFFVMGVLPQAIKLFSMKGIPMTQTIAAVFLFSTFCSMARTLRTRNPQKDIVQLVDRLKIMQRDRAAEGVVTAFGWGLHGASLYMIWYWMEDSLYIPVSRDVYDAIQWIEALAIIFISIYILQHTGFMLVGMKPPIPRYPVLILFLCTSFLGLPLLLTCRCAIRRPRRGKITVTQQVFISMAVLSCLIAYMLQFFALRIIRWRKKAHLSNDQSSDLPLHSLQNPGEGEAESGQIQGVQGSNEPDPPKRISNEHGSNLPLEGAESDSESVKSNGAIANRGDAALEGPSASASLLRTPSVDVTSARSSATHEQATSQTETGGAEGKVASSSQVDITDKKTTDTSKTGLSNSAVENNTSNTVSQSNDADAPERPDSLLLTILCWTLAIIAVPIVFPLIAANDPELTIRDRDEAQQDEAERGASSPQAQQAASTAQTDTVSGCRAIIQRVQDTIIKIFQYTVYWCLKLVGRLFLAFLSLFMYSFNWIGWKLKSQSEDTAMVAFGVANFLTAVVYYLVLYNGDGTVSPSWTSFLG